MFTANQIKSLLIGMILQARRTTKEPYRLRRLRRSSVGAGPTEQQPKNEVFPGCRASKTNNEVFPGACRGGDGFGEKRGLPRFMAENGFVTRAKLTLKEKAL